MLIRVGLHLPSTVIILEYTQILKPNLYICLQRCIFGFLDVGEQRVKVTRVLLGGGRGVERQRGSKQEHLLWWTAGIVAPARGMTYPREKLRSGCRWQSTAPIHWFSFNCLQLLCIVERRSPHYSHHIPNYNSQSHGNTPCCINSNAVLPQDTTILNANYHWAEKYKILLLTAMQLPLRWIWY